MGMDVGGSKGWGTSGFWASPALSWAMVLAGLALFHFSSAPSLPDQIAQCSRGMGVSNLMLLGYLFAISVVPIIGLWRLSTPLRLPRALSLLYLIFPLATVGVYLVRPLLDRMTPSR
jgi:hypothetical protein